jgi:hypothetical protein
MPLLPLTLRQPAISFSPLLLIFRIAIIAIYFRFHFLMLTPLAISAAAADTIRQYLLPLFRHIIAIIDADAIFSLPLFRH